MKTIPQDKDLILRSANALKEISGTKDGVDIGVIKNIPTGSGAWWWKF